MFGHIPHAPTHEELTRLQNATDPQHHAILAECNKIDVAEACCRSKNLRHVIRLHSAFPHRAALRSLPISELRIGLETLTDEEFRASATIKQLQSIKDLLRNPLDRHEYPSDSESSFDEAVSDEVIYCRWLLPNQTQLELPSPDNDDEEDDRSQSSLTVSLSVHTKHVVERVYRVTAKLSTQFDSLYALSAQWHDLGKADLRFQAMLSGLTPSETMERKTELAKGNGRRLTNMERDTIRKRAQFPIGFRHEFLSSQIVENIILDKRNDIDTDVVLRLIESHHGYARPFAGVVGDRPTSDVTNSVNITSNDLRSIYLRKSDHWPEIEMNGDARDRFVPSHRLDSGVSQRFWKLTRRFGWWGLAYMEAIMRLADQRASAAEELGQL